jgi:hypothetical protein
MTVKGSKPSFDGFTQGCWALPDTLLPSGTICQVANTSYIDAFGNEETAFKKAWQALLNFSDHEGLDKSGRRIGLSASVDMQAADPNETTFATRRVVRNGQIQPIDGPAWDDTVANSQATYSVNAPLTQSNVASTPIFRWAALSRGTESGVKSMTVMSMWGSSVSH